MATPSTLPAGSLSPTPAWVVHLFTFMNSMGTALVTNGVFYITESGYGFTRTDNFWLALYMGASYVVSAWTTQPVVAWLRRKLPGLSSRGVLLTLMVALAALCLVPLGMQMCGASSRSGRWGLVGIWVTVLAYNMLTGVLWPMVESFIAGGRRGDELRRTMGTWNVCWASAAIPATFLLAPLVHSYPNEAIASMTVIHLAAAWLLTRFTHEPVPLEVDEPEPHPPIYDKLLVAFRLLMPMAYAVFTTLSPMLTTMFGDQGVDENYRPLLGLSWVVPRILGFLIFGMWAGGHGKWWPAVGGGVTLVVGFGIAVLSPQLGSPSVVLPVMMVGLGVFGLGMSMVYSGAIYYAMEVHKSDVEAGGTHETLVGIGYTAGPMCGLLATGGVGTPWGAGWDFGTVLFSLVGLGAVGWTIWVMYRVRHLAASADAGRR